MSASTEKAEVVFNWNVRLAEFSRKAVFVSFGLSTFFS